MYEWVIHKRTKKKFDKIVSTNEWFWFPLTTTTTEYYIDNWSNKFTIHLSNLVTVEYLSLFKLQFTKDAQVFLPLDQYTHGHVWSWTVASFQSSLGQLGMVWHTSKCVGEVFLPSQLCLNNQVSPQIKIWSIEIGRMWGLYWNIFMCSGVGISPLKFVQEF